MHDPDVNQLIREAVRRHEAGDLQQAEAIYAHVLRDHPEHPEALHLMGVIAHQNGRWPDAEDLIRRAIRLAPADPRFHNNLGEVLRAQGRYADAAACYTEALRLDPDSPDALYNLGTARLQQGRFNDAVAALQRAAALKPDLTDAHVNLGLALVELGRLDDAVGAYHDALRSDPRSGGAHNNLGVALLKSGDPTHAADHFRAALSINPSLTQARNNLGKALFEVGRVREAIDNFQQAVRGDPDFVEAHSNLLFTLHYDPGRDRDAIFQAHLDWARRHAEPLTRRAAPHTNGPDPGRRLRVGYVSPDFRRHPVAVFVEPLLENHDHAGFHVTAYSDVTQPDAVTDRLRRDTDAWVSLLGMSDQAAADRVRADRIDVLVDLTGHIARNRLLLFARKPAPVQVTYIGYPDTTGMSAIDYRLTDALLDPPGVGDRYHTESLIRLEGSFCCYRPPDGAPDPGPLPALRNGHVTFGCFHSPYKINADVVSVWSQILHALPHARLHVLVGGREASAAETAPLSDAFRAHGVGPTRVTFIPKRDPAAYHYLYHDVDIALDPFPYNGHTTSCDGLWMGVPFVTLIGSTHLARTGWELLTNVGLEELAADSPQAYVKIATELASDADRLAHLRAGLRTRMARSILTDGPRLARQIESAYRLIWRKWCHNKP